MPGSVFQHARSICSCLTWGLPGMDGVSLCRRIRISSKKLPILMLTARDTVDDRVEGLAAGADDYLVKPFSLRELACPA